MGCALEIGWVNKERGAVSFTWLSLLTVLFALSQSLLSSFFISIVPPSPPQHYSPVSFALSSTLLALSAPSSAPLPLFLAAFVSSVPTIFRDCSRTVVGRSVHLLLTEGLFFTVFWALYEFMPSCGISRWIFLLVCVIAPSMIWNGALIALL